MKSSGMVIFFGVFFLVYGLINTYIILHAWQAIPVGSALRAPLLVLAIMLALSFIAGRVMERLWPSSISTGLIWVGSLWLGAMLYFFLAVVVFDLVRLVNHFLPFFPEAMTRAYGVWKFRVALVTVGAVVLLLGAGYLNARTPRVRELTFPVAKTMEGGQSMTIVAASDIHLGTIIGRERLRSLVDQINSLAPDVVLLPGDIVDEDLAPVVRENLGETLREIRARYGVFAITGNHEYIGGAEAACRYLAEHGIIMLRDSLAHLPNGVVIAGREDLSGRQFGGVQRKPLKELLAGIDTSHPVILLDHQPFHLAEGAENGVDVQLSGHTHDGQLWPLNYITRAVYEVSWGYLRKGGTHIYVSCGVGTWGPPVRLGNRPEILHITLRSQGDVQR